MKSDGGKHVVILRARPTREMCVFSSALDNCAADLADVQNKRGLIRGRVCHG